MSPFIIVLLIRCHLAQAILAQAILARVLYPFRFPAQPGIGAVVGARGSWRAEQLMAAPVAAEGAATMPSPHIARRARRDAAMQATAGLLQRLRERVLELEGQVASLQVVVGQSADSDDPELAGRLQLAAPVIQAGIKKQTTETLVASRRNTGSHNFDVPVSEIAVAPSQR